VFSLPLFTTEQCLRLVVSWIHLHIPLFRQMSHHKDNWVTLEQWRHL